MLSGAAFRSVAVALVVSCVEMPLRHTLNSNVRPLTTPQLDAAYLNGYIAIMHTVRQTEEFVAWLDELKDQAGSSSHRREASAS